MAQISHKYFSVFIIFLFHLTLPTADSLSDWLWIRHLVLKGQTSWALLSSIPILISTIFNFSAWIFEEHRNQVSNLADISSFWIAASSPLESVFSLHSS